MNSPCVYVYVIYIDHPACLLEYGVVLQYSLYMYFGDIGVCDY